MTGNSFGQQFRITTAGESHGPANLVIIDGCPPGVALSESDIQPDLDRRRPGQSKITTQRREPDTARILSGVFEGKTTGTAIAIIVENTDQRSRDYGDIMEKYRPGHADYTYDAKYGFRDYRGGGRASARETVARVAAGAVARKLLAGYGIEVIGFVTQVGDVTASIPDPLAVTQSAVEANIARCPDETAAQAMIELIDRMRKAQDSIGGVAAIVAKHVPPGLGEPVFGKLKADLAHGLMSIPAVTAFEYGAGFDVAQARGSENNDRFTMQDGQVTTVGNRHGGMLGGISSGLPIVLRVAVKPTSSLSKPQDTIDRAGHAVSISTRGRHDPCLLPRFVPIGEAMVLVTLADHLLRWRAQCPDQYAAWRNGAQRAHFATPGDRTNPE
ncbi:chorismate synthase [Sulfidibacter corallicola]|uniref:Chorismate synthase n=1 Tax=Sulfidibacter corallicola TaxID=2818388 RepID=A0A8A4TUH5_SULCO|nr:chorismate synthase [Sulfidibacter corallicola]QTD52682.1 chorismate synthase [Sulfidibacter corallicola]